ncbi:MAG: flavodoxin domain-containing protein [Defluviitaleaceae bacterium]|nr:flavodoxin domain-containing protein [Defluviitaleaceae bacterium]
MMVQKNTNNAPNRLQPIRKIAVTYKSQYGTTKQYAGWIAQELNATLLELSEAKNTDLTRYDLIIHGGGLYAGGIGGLKTVLKKSHKSLVVFTVGLADPKTADYFEILKMGFTEEQLSQTKVFHLRGGIDYSKLNFLHKGMMAARHKYFNMKSPAELSEEDKEFITTYGDKVDFVDKVEIEPLVAYVRGKIGIE